MSLPSLLFSIERMEYLIRNTNRLRTMIEDKTKMKIERLARSGGSWEAYVRGIGWIKTSDLLEKKYHPYSEVKE